MTHPAALRLHRHVLSHRWNLPSPPLPQPGGAGGALCPHMRAHTGRPGWPRHGEQPQHGEQPRHGKWPRHGMASSHGTASGHGTARRVATAWQRQWASGEGGPHSPRRRRGADPGLGSHNNQFSSAQTDLSPRQRQDPERLVGPWIASCQINVSHAAWRRSQAGLPGLHLAPNILPLSKITGFPLAGRALG